MTDTGTFKNYAGRIGHSDGVVVYIFKDENLKVRPTISIRYYAWNDRTLSKPGYGTKDLKITAAFSPTKAGSEYIIEEFALIKNSGNGDGNCQLQVGNELMCGRVIKVEQARTGDHQYNTVYVELNDEMRKKLEHTICLLEYSTVVNDLNQSFNNIHAILVEKR